VPPALPKPATQPAPLKPLPAVPPMVAAATPASKPAAASQPVLKVVEAPHPKPRPDTGQEPAAPQIAQAQASSQIVQAPRPQVRPDGRADTALAAAQAQLVKTAVNTPAVAVDAPRPQIRPSLRDDAGEGDSDVTPTPGHNWTIQIGAYADKALAAAQLKTYYGKAQDVLARASQIIAPITSPQGHVLYRARFGLFAEQEAKEVCNRLTQRGQTCFAAVQTR
jgi:D-alanyl-D-alanine carboxypeptidase